MSDLSPKTVKARKHTGSKTLDLTIPADISKELSIKEGDVFLLESEVKNGEVILKYKKIHSSNLGSK